MDATSDTCTCERSAKAGIYSEGIGIYIVEARMTKTLIDIDDDELARAQQALRTVTKKDTVNRALSEATALAARRRDLERLIEGRLADLGDAEIMTSAWQR